MRQIFCKKYSFYKFLEDLKDLPDNCNSQPYYDSDFTEYNIFYTFTRFNPLTTDDESYFVFTVSKKQLNHRISYGNTQRLYSLKIMESEFYPLILNPSFNTLADFIKLLISLNKHLSDLLDEQWLNQSRV